MASPRILTLQLAALSLLAMLGTCRSGPAGGLDGPPAKGTESTMVQGWHYDVTVAPTLTRADVRVCFSGPAPARLIPGLRFADAYAHDFEDAAGQALPRSGRGYDLSALGEDACVRYWVDFEGLENSGESGRMVGRTGRSLMVRPSLWVWRPDMLPDEADVTARLSLPEGMQASVPWPIEPGTSGEASGPTYRLDRSAFYWLAYTAFGTLTVDRFEHAGTQVELVTLDAAITCPPEGLRAWATAAMDSVALLYDGRFPRERLQLVVLPVEGNGEGTVYFGMAGRGGGPAIYVFLDDHAEAERMRGGWTTVHEMLHHGMPFIQEPWMAEGWVTYYTELMRTRAGFRTEAEGWRALARGFERGQRRAQELTLAEASELMRDRHIYQRVYWGGAAVALLTDVQMRLETDGARSLDDAMVELRRCCGEADQRWPARALLEKLDAWYGRPLFTQTADAVLSEPGFPDVKAALARVGVEVVGDEVRLSDDPAQARHRRPMMAPRPVDAP